MQTSFDLADGSTTLSLPLPPSVGLLFASEELLTPISGMLHIKYDEAPTLLGLSLELLAHKADLQPLIDTYNWFEEAIETWEDAPDDLQTLLVLEMDKEALCSCQEVFRDPIEDLGALLDLTGPKGYPCVLDLNGYDFVSIHSEGADGSEVEA